MYVKIYISVFGYFHKTYQMRSEIDSFRCKKYLVLNIAEKRAVG